jgi:glycosyltransferase involved in cell wall biosynthesis
MSNNLSMEIGNGHQINQTAAATTMKPFSMPFADSANTHPKVAYIMSRFSKMTKSLILNEMLSVEQHGVQVELYPLLRERKTIVPPEAEPFVKRAHFQPFISWPILRAHLSYLRQKPGTYLNTLWTVLRANLGSFRFFAGAVGLFPKTVYFAYQMIADGITHVHAHYASHPAAAAYIIHRLTGIPYSFTAHGSDLHRDQHMLYEKVAKAAFVVPLSNYSKEMILARCTGRFREKLTIIHCGVDTQLFQPLSESTPFDRGIGPFTILCIGSLRAAKGQTYLIEACRLLKERGIKFSCHFAGYGPDLEDLFKQATQAGLSGRIQFHGQLTRQKIIQLLSRADVVAAPSEPSSNGRREVIPLVLLEAMSSGVPVIASNISRIPELIEDGHSGLLIPPHDAQALADALARMQEDPDLRRRLGRAGRDKITREYDLRQNATTLAQYFALETQP